MTARLVITAGEPSGIGPDLVLMLAQSDWPVQLVVLTDRETLKVRAQQLDLPTEIIEYDAAKPAVPSVAGQIVLEHIPVAEAVVAGQLNKHNADHVIRMLKRAIHGCLNNEFAGMVTGPVHKGIINEAGQIGRASCRERV